MGPTKRATISLINGKSCNTLLRMLLECIRSYLQSVLRYKYFKFGYLSYTHTLYHIYIHIYIHTIFTWARKGIRGYLSKSNGIRQQKSLRNTDSDPNRKCWGEGENFLKSSGLSSTVHNQKKEDKMVGVSRTHVRNENSYKVLVRKPVTSLLGGYERSWVEMI